MRKLIINFLLCILLLSTACTTNTMNTQDNFDLIELNDGSTIYLNHNTSIAYPKDFSADRTVHLTGEAYFDVAKSQTPFTIKTTNGSILITGTVLNVEANKEELIVEVDEGTVEVKTKTVKTILEKGQRAVKKAVNDIKVEKAKGEFKNWLRDMEKDFEKMGKHIGKGLKKGEGKLEKGAEKAEKKIKKIFN